MIYELSLENFMKLKLIKRKLNYFFQVSSSYDWFTFLSHTLILKLIDSF